MTARPAHLGWRLIAIVYDVLPALALWFVPVFVFQLTQQARPMAELKPDPLAGYIELALLWLIPGIYMVVSWRRGGATLGMRPWRLKVLDAHGQHAAWGALWLRYAVATLSLLAFGLGFLWTLFDPERRSWHDLASRTRFVRMDKD